MSALRLPRAARAWGTPAFAAALQAELEALGPDGLPLQQGLQTTSSVLDQPVQVMLIGTPALEMGRVRARVGVFYAGILGGCSCADDPTPVEAQPEYCELEILLNPADGAASVHAAG